jgi:hypothetical protein
MAAAMTKTIVYRSLICRPWVVTGSGGKKLLRISGPNLTSR